MDQNIIASRGAWARTMIEALARGMEQGRSLGFLRDQPAERFINIELRTSRMARSVLFGLGKPAHRYEARAVKNTGA